MLTHRPPGVDDDHLAARLHTFAQVPQEGIRARHFVIHVDQENAIERAGREHRVVGRAQFDSDIVEPFALDPVAKLIAPTTRASRTV